MLNIEAMHKEIEHLSRMIVEIELAAISEEDPVKKNGLKSALGQLRAGRTWMLRIMKEDNVGSNKA